MHIRPAREADLPLIIRIERECYPYPWAEVFFQGHLGEKGFMVCEMEGEIAGYIVVGIKIPSLFERLEMRTKVIFGHPIELEERKGHIMNIAVDPQKRARGLGAALLQSGLDYLQEMDGQTAELEVRVSNFNAIRLYQRFGFQIEKRIYQYYHDGEDGYMMCKVLQPTSTQPASES